MYHRTSGVSLVPGNGCPLLFAHPDRQQCWIGAHSVVLPGVTIGDNAVIGAGSIVTRDIPANTVAVGNPCRVMREITDRDREYYFRNLRVDLPYTMRVESLEP